MVLNEILNLYENAAIKYGDAAQELNDAKEINRFHDSIVNCYLILKATGDDDVKKLSKLLNHSNSYVVLWAATHLLPFTEKLAKSVLTDLVDTDSLLGFEAKMTLKEWDIGRLTLNYENYEVNWNPKPL